jgi:hypothetical protein
VFPKKTLSTYFFREFQPTWFFLRTGIPWHYNATRHSVASQALNAGGSLDRLSAALGHSNLKITRRHASLNVQKLRDVVDGFGQGLGQLSDKQKIREINPRIMKRNMVGDAGFEPATPAV